MASVPVPRSKNQILADIMDSFLSRIGLTRIKIGGPLLSMFEAAAQSQFRSSADVFNMLAAQSLDSASDSATDKTAKDEGTKRISVTSASGFVNFSDTSFTKITSSIYQGSSAPNTGTITLKVSDASSFPNTGKIYIGRGTVNFEGPLSYTAKADLGSYWTLTITGGTTKFHNLSEAVTLAKGGVRTIPSGTSVQTPQGNVSNAVAFSTIYSSQIEDGETLVSNVEVIAQQPGTLGNVPAGAISSVQSPPFVGCAVTNPLPFTNGLSSESTPTLKERIKDLRQSRQLGTALAISTFVQGVTSKEDNKTVISSSVVARQGETSTLYIDDGTGYEESLQGVSSETLMDSALGGEQLFQLSSQRPIAKAFALTTLTAPFNLSAGEKLSVYVGGILSEHSFNSSSFSSIANATAYEVVASINGNPNLTFSARTAESATKVAIFAKSETNEDIEVGTPASGNDANVYLGFPTQLNYTLRLYKNDEFLYKDGNPAILISNSQGEWSNSIGNGDTLLIAVDGTSIQTVTFSDSDFVTANTGYTSVAASNSLAAWATVINAKIVGVTATGTNGVLTLVSNLGNNSRAKLDISGGTLVTKSMFSAGIDYGKNSDYTLNRNTGQLKLSVPLSAGDDLVIATPSTRAYVESASFPSSTVTLPGTANLWFVVDGNAEIIPTGVNSGSILTITNPAGNRALYTAVPVNTFANIQKGDTMIVWDTTFTDRGVWKISDIDTVNFQWIEVEHSTPVAVENLAPLLNGIVFVRTLEPIQKVQVAAGVNIPLATIASSITSSLIGGSSSVYKNTKLRVNTDTYDMTGDIMLVTADTNGQILALNNGALVENKPSHYAAVESGNSELGTPNFKWTYVATTPSSATFTTVGSAASLGLRAGDLITYRKRIGPPPVAGATPATKYGADATVHEVVHNINTATGVVTPRINSKTAERLSTDRLFSSSAFTISPNDNLSVLLDEESDIKNYSISLYRNIVPLAGEIYGAAPFQVRDADNGNASLFSAFGVSSDLFNDFALLMNARGKSHSTTVNKTILYRFQRMGQEGNFAKVSYSNPTAPSQSLALSTDVDDGYANIDIRLPSSAARAGLNINGNNYFTSTSNQVYTASGANVSRAANVVTVVLGSFSASNIHTLTAGDVIYLSGSTDPNFLNGPKVIASTTANTFTYNEVGAAVGFTVSPLSFLTSKRPAGTTYTVSAGNSSGTAITLTIGAHAFAIGDTVYFEPGHEQGAGMVITAGAKVVTAIGATTITWDEVTTAGALVLVGGIPYTVSSGAASKVTVCYYKAECLAGSLVRAGSTVTATINTTFITGNQPYSVGDIVYLSPGEANFTAGPKIITAVTPTTISYTESGAAGASGLVQYFTSTPSDLNFTGGGTPVVAGDIAHIGSSSGLDPLLAGNFRVFDVTSTTFSFLKDIWYQNGLAVQFNGQITPKKLGATANLQFSPINGAAATASIVSTWVNSNASSLIKAVLVPDNTGAVNAGTAQINVATEEEFFLTTSNASINGVTPISTKQFSLYDGINWIQTTSLVDVANSTVGLKNPVNGELVQYNDFNAEAFKFVPVTAQNFVNYLGSTGVSGFGSNGYASISSDGKKLQLASNLLGSQGAVHVTGGSGNAASAEVIGLGAPVATNYSKVTVDTNQINGFTGGAFVSVQGTNNAVKDVPLLSTDTVTITAVSGTEQLVTFTNPVVMILSGSFATSRSFQIERHGNYMAYIDCSGAANIYTSANEGDLVLISDTGFSGANTGTFTVVRVDSANRTFWVENPNGIEELATITGDLYFYQYDSASFGDTFVVNSDILGSANKGSFRITRIDPSVTNTFYVSGMTPASATLGPDYVFLQIREAAPIKLVKQIRAINRNPVTSTNSDIVFTTSAYAEKMNENTGSLIVALDKLAFPTSEKVGLDGYSYNTGLLAEVNRVVYGDETNSAVYPGLNALSTNVNIAGPLIKPVKVSVSVRLRTGVNADEVFDKIRSAIAAVINSSPVGENIAISDIVEAVNEIDGVLSVTIISPVYNLGNDLIPVQRSEKPKVLDINNDILISKVE